ncbi:aminopeptidase N-like isoform X2 [Linepithema humile]|uniref:aminopeptidase N-like isoform X2 n=1 Tax=Linepithema humile TaxID=83485 RepID=UPI00351E27ED
MFFREVDIIDETLDHLFRRREIVHMIARQLAFLWSYDVLLWSKEGFASFFGAYILNEIFKDYYMMDLMVIQTQLDSFHYDTPSTTVSEANSLVLPLNNMKSFIIWRMLYHLIPDVFWSGIHQYIDKHTTTPDDLWTTMETIHKAKLPSHEPHLFLKNIIKSWITKKYYSVLNMTRNDENSSIAIDFILSPYLKANEKTKSWIPVTYTMQWSVKYNISDRLFWLTSHSLRRVIPVIDKNDFILLNIKQTGYYRVNYDERTWYNLIHFLNSENYTKIHVLNRAQLIDDAFYLLLQKQFNYKMFWEFTRSVLRDMNFVTWYPMFKVFESMSCRFPLDYGMDAKIQMRTMMLPLLEKIGYLHNQSDNLLIDIVYLREEAVKWACMLNVIDCRKEAAKILSRDLDNNKHSGILRTGEKWIYCYGFDELTNLKVNKSQDLIIIDKHYASMLLRFQATNDNRYLEYLTCTKSDYVILLYLSLLAHEDASKENQLQGNVRASAFLSVIEKHAENDKVLSFLFENFANITFSSNRKNDIIAILIVAITNISNKVLITKLTDYVTHHYAKQIVEVVKRKIKKRDWEYRRLCQNFNSILT